MTAWNFFRFTGDMCHLASKLILLVSIHRNRSAEGVSFITQILYCVVFLSRYTDVFSEAKYEHSEYNRIFKLFYILSSVYIIGAMQWMFPRTRERELAWKFGAACLAGSLLLSPFTMLIFEPKLSWSFFTWLLDFSFVLESVCILPQLLLLRQTTVPTVIDSYYLVALALYRIFYILNWIARDLDITDQPPNPIKVIFGILQTALFVDFAWVYYTRQRVKLRAGGLVDADDMRKSWFLRRIFGNHVDREDGGNGDEEEGRPALGGGGARGGNATRRGAWGRRGISVSADEGVLGSEGRPFMEDDEDGEEEHGIADIDAPDAKMKDPDELALALDDEDEAAGASGSGSGAVPHDVSGGAEWRD